MEERSKDKVKGKSRAQVAPITSESSLGSNTNFPLQRSIDNNFENSTPNGFLHKDGDTRIQKTIYKFFKNFNAEKKGPSYFNSLFHAEPLFSHFRTSLSYRVEIFGNNANNSSNSKHNKSVDKIAKIKHDSEKSVQKSMTSINNKPEQIIDAHFYDQLEHHAKAQNKSPSKKLQLFLRYCCACAKKKKETAFSHYVVKLDPELKDRMTLMLDSLRDYNQSLEATLKATQASKNKKLIKTMSLKMQLHETFTHLENALYLLHRVHFYCGDAIRTLSYYFENDLTPDKLKKVQGRSVLGSYMWVITLCMQAIQGNVDKDAEELDEIKRTLEDIVGQSFVIWHGVSHIVNAFIDCRMKTESILHKYIEKWDPDKNFKLYRYSNMDDTLQVPKAERFKFLQSKEKEFAQNEVELRKARAKRLKDLKLHNKVGDNQAISICLDPECPLPPPPAVKIVRCRMGENIWVPYKEIRTVDRLLTLNQLAKKVVQILEEVHGHLRGMDKFIHLFSDPEDRQEDEQDMSFLQAILRLNKLGKKLCSVNPSQLSLEDRDALVQMSKVLLDELDLTEFLIMTLRSLVHETRHAIHVSYEYTRLFFPRSLIQYEFISPPDTKSCFERLNCWKTALEDYEFDKIEFRSAVIQFNTSKYIKILEDFPVKEIRHILMLQPL